MSSTMEVDTPAPKKDDNFSIQVHPLALVHMSDQYTRITGGGSPLAKTDPVVGLLYGHWTTTAADHTKSTSSTILAIKDAGDVPLTAGAELAATHVALHQAVYPLQQVVGWYRVADTTEPTPEDLQMTMQLAERYYNSADSRPFFLGVLAVSKVEKDELPLGLYHYSHGSDKNVLVACEDWKLTTAHAERVAVERVVREKTSTSFVAKSEPLSTSLTALDDRLQILVQFLQDTADERIPLHPALLRQVQSLLLRLGGEAVPSAPQDAFWVPLASMAVTVDAVCQYTEKFRSVQEIPGSGGRAMRDLRRQH